MSILNKLATALNRRDEVPNQELARQLAAKSDQQAVKELVDNLSNKSRDIQNDCIKVIYEIGELKPALIAPYAKNFLGLLNSKNNRLQWGAMAALDKMTAEDPKLIYTSLPQIMDACNAGSVITRDNGVNILIRLCAIKAYAANASGLLMEQLMNCPVNQVPMYAERAMPIINEKNKKTFIQTLSSRLKDIEKETGKKRVEKIIKKLLP